ncbi:sensor histidine kinase [Furfurilactobacillus siliginis]|uniref:histidine kinase n=1 Tax=Furfurilactobacillus siliginis TaxID=348151 RepID=A0A0R2LEH6_9LACO|nr:ATP-binding protein [Furfurilactobacillus siliginis]KRN96596.1 histidine protein kinase [Furfurilactobacillus siliginis]GEK29067.1 two-component sensor histidine kinase [Furfurilactobacillus siliginis]
MQTLRHRLLGIATIINAAVLLFILVVWQRPDGIVSEGLVALVVLLATIIEGSIIWWLITKQEAVVNDLTLQVQRLGSPQTTQPILLPADHAYADLAHAINLAADELRHQSHVFERQKSELDSLLEYLPVGVMLIDRNRQTQLLNPMAAQLLEINVGTIPHPYTADVRHYDLMQQVEQTLKTQKRQRQTLTLKLPTADRTLEVSTIYNEPRSHHAQVLVLLYDLTEVTQIEQMQLDFVANASHELKTPLTAIIGFTETLQAGAKEDAAKRDEFLQIIDDQAHELMDLVEDVLSVSRIQSPRRQSTPLTTVTIADVINDQLKLQAQSIERRQLHVQNNVATDFNVHGDLVKLTQIIKNLLSNAIKYNHTGGEITFSLTTTATDWQLAVTDTGYGMTTAQQERVFERFYRADLSRTKQRIPGTGLGLAIVQELTTVLGGHVQIMSQVDAGTTMLVSFPIK